MSGVRRNLFNKINNLLNLFPALVILGAKQIGKTYLSKQLRPDWKYFDLENQYDYERITSDLPFFFKENPQNLIIDEAQSYPELFKALRGVIDNKREEKGRFIITGFSSYELIEKSADSLADSVAVIELGTLKRNEIFSKKLSSFYSIFNKKLTGNDIDFIKSLKPVLSASETNQAFLRVVIQNQC